MGTLAKIAVGVAVAKGIGSMMGKGGSGLGGGAGAGGGTGGGIFGDGGTGGTARLPGGLEDVMGGVLGGRTGGQSGGRPDAQAGRMPGGGGLGDLLENLGTGRAGGGGSIGGGSAGGSGGGGLGDLIGQLGAGGSGGGGGLGDLLGGLLGGALGGAAAGAPGGGSAGPGGSFGDLLNQALGNRGEPEARPTREQDAVAGLMLKAMIQAAKSDGKIDAEEKRKLLDNLGDISPEEKRFVESELAAQIDIDGLARQVPRGLEQQVYAMSVMAINLDNRNEAQYLARLADGMGIGKAQVNGIHAQLGVPALYA